MKRFLGGFSRLLLLLGAWLRLFLSLAFGDYRGFRGWRLGELLRSELGAVTVTFLYPGAAPTQATMANLSAAVATVIASADADTTATLTHNMQLTAAQLAFGWPIVVIEYLVSFAAAAFPAWAVTGSTANALTLTKNTAVGSGNAAAQIQVSILRPNSLIE